MPRIACPGSYSGQYIPQDGVLPVPSDEYFGGVEGYWILSVKIQGDNTHEDELCLVGVRKAG